MENILFFLCITGGLWGTANSADMTSIKYSKDAKPFAGKTVAYTAASYYFNCGESAFTLESNSTDDAAIRYGVIWANPVNWDTGETGFDMMQVLKKGQGHGVSALIFSQLKGEKLAMRLITEEERAKLKAAIDNDTAEFIYNDKDEEKRLLSN